MGHKFKVAIHIGEYPDTTFLTLLVSELSLRNDLEVHLYGKKRKGYHGKELARVKSEFIPNNKIGIIFYFVKYITNIFFKKPLYVYRIINIAFRSNVELAGKFYNILKILPYVCNKPEVIHIQWIKDYSLFDPYISLLSSRFIVSVRGHQLSISAFTNEHYRQVILKALNAAFIIHSISDDLSQKVIELQTDLSEKIVKITPAIDTKIFMPRHIKPKGQKIIILTVARLSWKKGFNYAFEAMEHLSQKGILFEFHVIGDGPQLEELTFYKRISNLENQIHFLGKKNQQEIVHYLQNADMFLMPSVQEGFSNAVLEAQAVGVPCVVTDAEGLAENVADEITGFVVPRRNALALAEALYRIIRLSNDEYMCMQLNCQKRVKDHFSLEEQIRAFVGLYKRTILK